jgi:peptide/nickel transport system substrate-binding protein
VRWEKGKQLEMEAFSGYWNGRPPIDKALFVPVEEGPKSVGALRHGDVDVLRWIPETMIGELERTPRVRLMSRPGLVSYYLWLNPMRRGGPRSPFADRRVRQAISMAIDRREVVKTMDGRALAANQLVQKGVFGYVAGLPELPYDPEQARRLLKSAGFPGGLDVTLAHRSQSTLRAVAERIREMLGRVGIRVTLETPEWASAMTRWRSGDIPFFLVGWRFEDGEVESFLRDCLFTREPKRNFGGFNPGYSNPELDRLIEENATIFREDDRLKHYEKLTRVAMDDMPLVPLYHRVNFYGVASDVQWEPRLDGKLLAAEMSRNAP